MSLPEPFPGNGLPLFTQDDERARQDVRAPLLSTHADARDCTRVVEIGMFFDGTNNNLERDLPAFGHTNVVRLFNAYPDRGDRYQYRHYIPGVGTRCDEVDDTDPQSISVKMLGRAAGNGGWRRIVLACMHVLNDIHLAWTGKYLMDDKVAIAAKVNSLEPPLWTPFSLRNSLQRQFAPELRRLEALRLQMAKPRIRRVNVSVFGFSRGAAQARVFANVLKYLSDAPGSDLIVGIPIYLQFLGVFDTVASLGPFLNSFNVGNLHGGASTTFDGHSVWATPQNLAAPAGVRSVHFVAAHEQRRAFPLDLMAGASVEHIYPGVHADVGGGYNPREEGRSLDPKAGDMLARIACMNMYRQARRAGVPLYALSEMPTDDARNDFAPIPPAVVKSFNAYLALCASATGDIYSQIHTQVHHYLRWRGAKLEKYEAHRFYADAGRQEQQDLWDANQQLKHDLAAPFSSDPEYEATRVQVRTTMDVAERAVCETLFANYVHDSLAGFMISGTDRSDMAKKQMQARAEYEEMVKLRALSPYPIRGRYVVPLRPELPPEGEYNTIFKRREPFSGYLQYRRVYPRSAAEVQDEANRYDELEKQRATLKRQHMEAEAYRRARP